MGVRKTILDQLLVDMQDNLSIAKGYNFTPIDIKRGIFKWGDFTDKPVVCFTAVRDEPHELEEYGAGARWLEIGIYGYMEDDGLGNSDKIQLLVQDVEDFLNNPLHHTYEPDTHIGGIEILEGGVSSPINSFIMEVRILYDNECG